jgi:hypothetical protein
MEGYAGSEYVRGAENSLQVVFRLLVFVGAQSVAVTVKCNGLVMVTLRQATSNVYFARLNLGDSSAANIVLTGCGAR